MEWICSNSSNDHIVPCQDDQGRADQSICRQYGNDVVCYRECVNDGTIESGRGCNVLQLNVQCDTDPGYCRWQGALTNCFYDANNDVCNEPSQTETKSCCGCPNPPCDDGGGGGSPTPPPACTATYPTSVVATSPADGAEVTTTTVTLSWNGPSDWGTGCPSNDNEYLVYVGEDQNNPTYQGKVPAGTTSYDFTGTQGKTYYWKIVADNGTYNTETSIRQFTIVGTVKGTVYLDENNSCSTSQPSNFGGGMTASLRKTGYSASVGNNGQFSIGAPGGSYTLDMTIPNGYICSTGPLGTGCGGGCPTQTGVTSPSTGNNFFFTQQRSAWWQVVGGDVYAGSTGGGMVIRSLIPGSVPASQRHLILSPDGVVIYRTGSLALDSGDVSAGGYKARAANYLRGGKTPLAAVFLWSAATSRRFPKRCPGTALQKALAKGNILRVLCVLCVSIYRHRASG